MPDATPAAAPIEQIKQSMRSMWMAGNFGVIAKDIERGGEEFIDRLAVKPGDRALDVACGTGNTALPLARRGAIVTGLDIAPNLLEQARERAAAEGLTIQFDEGDAEAMPYPDESFDIVTTMFGAMFAPRPEMVASEFARVTKPGGRIAMANWNPESFTGLMFRTSSKHAPPPPGVPPPVLWGNPETVRQRLDPYFTAIETEIVPVSFKYDFPPAQVVAHFREHFGPTKTAFARLDPAAQTAFENDLVGIWTAANISSDPNRVNIPNCYLQVTAVRK